MTKKDEFIISGQLIDPEGKDLEIHINKNFVRVREMITLDVSPWIPMMDETRFLYDGYIYDTAEFQNLN